MLYLSQIQRNGTAEGGKRYEGIYNHIDRRRDEDDPQSIAGQTG
jgi:hypothetical protein